LVRNQICSRLISANTGIIATKSSYESNINEIVDLTYGDKRISKRFLTIMTIGVVSNDSFLHSGFHFTNRTDVTDGYLDIIVIKNPDTFQNPTEINKHKKQVRWRLQPRTILSIVNITLLGN
jgi:hypothetical protein